MGTPRRRHRTTAALAAILVIGASACGGGGGGSAAEPDDEEGPPACVQELISIAQRADVVAAAQAGQALPADASAEFQAVSDGCQSEIATLSETELTELASSLDPAVLALLSAPQPESFEETADTIGG